MCLVVTGFGVHERYRLIIAGNRDEFHARPTRDAHWWPDDPDILGGRDLQAGGTWLALHRSGRFATVTNFRDAQIETGKLRSRGHLVTEFLQSDIEPMDYLAGIDGDEYAGFNLLVSDGASLAYLSNRGIPARQLGPGIYGLGNATLDAPWHKVEQGKVNLHALVRDDRINETELLRMLDDREKGPVSEVETGRLSFETAHALTAPFIVMPEYGTRSSSTVLLDAAGRWQFVERRFDPEGKLLGETRHHFGTTTADV